MKKAGVPKVFLKKYSSKRLNSKILNKIHIPKDRQMVSDLYTEKDNGKMGLKENISPETLAKLKILAKSIKKNKGFVTTWKVAIVLILVGLILSFNLFFKDNLIKRTTESGLEFVFDADVELVKPHLSLFSGIMTFEALIIANSDKPMYNLLETGQAQLQISIVELIRKKVCIERMSLENVKWNTPRTIDGSLSTAEQSERKQSVDKIEGYLDFLSLNSEDFDYNLLLEQQMENLVTLAMIENSNEIIEDFNSRWISILEKKEEDNKILSAKVEKIKALNLKNISTIEQAQLMVQQIEELYSEVEALKGELKSLSDDYEGEKENLGLMENSITSAIEEDLSYLLGLLDFSVVDLRAFSADIAENYIRNRWNKYYEYGLKALNIYNRLRSIDKRESVEKTGLSRDSGRNISFPSPDNPKFLIEHFLISGGDKHSGELTVDLKSISNDPNKVKSPISMNVSLNKENGELSIDGFLDLRSNSEKLFRLSIQSPPTFWEIEDVFSGKVVFVGNSSFDRNEKGLTTSINMELNNLTTSMSKVDSLIMETIENLIEKQKTINLTGEMLINSEGIDRVTIHSEFDDLLVDSLGAYLSDLEETATQELENNLKECFDSDLIKNQELLSSIDALGIKIFDQINTINNLEKILDSKTAELEDKVNSMVNDVKNDV